jgi:hypothetical protein
VRSGVAATGRVEFDTGTRCLGDAATGCAELDPGRSVAYWPDRPTDLVCLSAPCTTYSPTFFVDYLLTKVRSEIYDPNIGGWRASNTLNVAAGWYDPDGAGVAPPQLWVEQIARTGASGATVASEPATRFDFSSGSLLDNRAETSMTISYWRIAQITDSGGAATSVVYKQPVRGSADCPSTGQDWDDNYSLCFPAWTSVGGSAGWGEFFKYVVSSVTEWDSTYPTNVITPIVTSYTYPALGAAWRWNDNAVTPASYRHYNEFRGFDHVQVTSGVGADRTVQELIYYRGMDQRPYGAHPPTTTAGAAVNTTSGWLTDHNQFRGMLVESRQLDPATLATKSYELYSLVGVQTATGATPNAYRVQTTQVDRGVLNAAGTSWVQFQTQNTYTTDGFLQQVWERGELTNPWDDRCTHTSFAPATTELRGLPNGQEIFNSTCIAANKVSYTETFYDGNASSSSTPSDGYVTRTKQWWNATNAIDTTYTFDTYGRPSTTTLAGATTTTTYPAINTIGRPITVTNHLGHAATTSPPGYRSGSPTPTTRSPS